MEFESELGKYAFPVLIVIILVISIIILRGMNKNKRL